MQRRSKIRYLEYEVIFSISRIFSIFFFFSFLYLLVELSQYGLVKKRIARDGKCLKKRIREKLKLLRQPNWHSAVASSDVYFWSRRVVSRGRRLNMESHGRHFHLVITPLWLARWESSCKLFFLFFSDRDLYFLLERALSTTADELADSVPWLLFPQELTLLAFEKAIKMRYAGVLRFS